MLYKLTIKIEGIKTYFAKNSIFIFDELNFNSKKLGTSNKKMKINTILDYNKIPVNKSFNTRLMVTLASAKTKSKKRNPLNLSLPI